MHVLRPMAVGAILLSLALPGVRAGAAGAPVVQASVCPHFQPAPDFEDVAYGSFDAGKHTVQPPGQGDIPLHLDVFMPLQPDHEFGYHPAVVLAHGGNFANGDKGICPTRDIAKTLIKHGFVVFVANYRLSCPRHSGQPMCRGAAKKGNPTSFSPFDPIDDLRAAVLWVRTHGGQYGADTSRLAAMGASAGGHASLLLGTAPGAGRPNLVASWSPPNNSLPKGYVGCAKSACRSTWEALTPADQASSGDAPTFLGHAVFDRQTAATQSVAIARALRRANVPVEMKLYATNAHGADLLPCAIDDTMIFLRARFGMPRDASLVALSAAECAAATTSVVQRTNA